MSDSGLEIGDTLYGRIYNPKGGINGTLDVAVKEIIKIKKNILDEYSESQSRELLLQFLNKALKNDKNKFTTHKINYCHIWKNIDDRNNKIETLINTSDTCT